MSKRVIRVAGLIVSILGICILFFNSSSLTGFVVAEKISSVANPFLGVIVFILGAVLMYASGSIYQYSGYEQHLKQNVRGYESLPEKDKLALLKAYRRHMIAEERRALNPGRLEQGLPVIYTDDFKRAIKNRPLKPIENAIEKLKKGKGKRERLKHMRGSSIRVDSGARIRYDITDKGIELLDYTPDHKYGWQH